MRVALVHGRLNTGDGGLATLYLASSLQWDAGYWVLVVALAAGIAGALLARTLFEVALVVFTCVAGAALLVTGLGLQPPLATGVFVGLAVAGVALQLTAGRRREKRS